LKKQAAFGDFLFRMPVLRLAGIILGQYRYGL
jgi:hypothetical protein